MAIIKLGLGTGVSGTLPRTNATSGSIIQVQRKYVANTGNIQTTSTSFVASGITQSITPTTSGNLILVDFNSVMAQHAGTGYGRAHMYMKTGTGSYAVMPLGSSYHMGYIDQSTNNYSPMCFGGSFTTTSTDQLTFQPYIVSNNSNSFRFVHDGGSYALTLMEVAP